VIGLNVKIDSTIERVLAEAEKAQFYALTRTAFRVFEHSRDSIEPIEGPSAPGTPPHTHTEGIVKSRRSKRFGLKRLGVLPRSIKYNVDRKEMVAVVGPTLFDAGLAGFIHEFGGEYKGGTFPARPFMRPAMDESLRFFGDSFEGSIGE
jgi:hypothetical protein